MPQFLVRALVRVGRRAAQRRAARALHRQVDRRAALRRLGCPEWTLRQDLAQLRFNRHAAVLYPFRAGTPW